MASGVNLGESFVGYFQIYFKMVYLPEITPCYVY